MFKPYSDTDAVNSRKQPTSDAVEGPPSSPSPVDSANAQAADLRDPTVFVLYKRNIPFIMGITHRLPGIGAGFLGIIGLVFIVPALCFLVPVLIDATALAQRGITTTATITDLHFTKSYGKNGPTYTYYVTVQFFDSMERVQNHTQSISKISYDRLRSGQTIMIVYDRDNPTVAQLSGKDQDNSSMNTALMGGALFGCISSVIVFVSLMGVLETRRIQRRARVLKGAILSISGYRDSKGRYSITLQCQLISPTGQTLVRKDTETRNDMADQPLPPVGTPVYVAYVNDKLFRVL